MAAAITQAGRSLKLFVWRDVLCDFGCGAIFALAETVEQARQVVLDKAKDDEKDYEIENLTLAMSYEPDVYTPAFGFWVNGTA